MAAPDQHVDQSFDQSFFQVRLDQGAAGLSRLAPCDVVVLVDALGLSAAAADAADAGQAQESDARIVAQAAASGHALPADAPIVAQAAASGATVIAGSLRNSGAVARAVLAEQARRGGRVSVAVIPVGASPQAVPGSAGFPDAVPGSPFPVADVLAAGAVVAALGDLGIDHTSPEAAAAGEAFRALRGAVRHLFAASGAGQALAAQGRHDQVVAAAELDATEVVPVLRDGCFVAVTPRAG